VTTAIWTRPIGATVASVALFGSLKRGGDAAELLERGFQVLDDLGR
jgi:hypothetical protein